MNMYRFTGKDYNDLGRYKSCVENDDLRYLLLNCKEDRCGNRFSVDVSLGLCIPKKCSDQDIRVAAPYF